MNLRTYWSAFWTLAAWGPYAINAIRERAEDMAQAPMREADNQQYMIDRINRKFALENYVCVKRGEPTPSEIEHQRWVDLDYRGVELRRPSAT